MNQIRGDTRQYTFKRVDNEGHPILTTPDGLYFTVKKSFYTPDALLQKTIQNMEMGEDGTWRFTIEASDTNNLDYGNYVYDLEVVDNGSVTTICTSTPPTDTNSLSSTISTARVCTDGVTLTGTNASAWKTALPDRASSPYRKLIDGTATT